MAKKPKSKKKPTYTKNPGLGQAKAPTLIKQNGDRIVAQSELTQLQDKREEVQRQLDKLEADILELKNRRKEELLAELKELGLDMPRVSAASSSGDGGKRKGRPKGFKMSDEQKKAMAEGRRKAREAKAGNKTEQPTLQEAAEG
jgi:hypothetical protein